MKYVSRPIIIEAELYKPGLEDGIYCPIKRTECDLCINNCKTKVPYVREKDGRITLVNESHYILSSDNGKTVMPMHKFTALYKPAEFIDVSNQPEGGEQDVEDSGKTTLQDSTTN